LIKKAIIAFNRIPRRAVAFGHDLLVSALQEAVVLRVALEEAQVLVVGHVAKVVVLVPVDELLGGGDEVNAVQVEVMLSAE